MMHPTTEERFATLVRVLAIDRTRDEIKAMVDEVYERITAEAAAKVYGKEQGR